MKVLSAQYITGGDRSLDKINVEYLQHGDLGMVNNGTDSLMYNFDSSSLLTHNPPKVVKPFDAIEGRWILQNINNEGILNIGNLNVDNIILRSPENGNIDIQEVTTTENVVFMDNFDVESYNVCSGLNADTVNGYHWADIANMDISGSLTLPEGIESIDVVMPNSMLYVSYTVYFTIINTSISDEIVDFVGIVTNKELNNFTVTFSNRISSPYYKMDWLVMPSDCNESISGVDGWCNIDDSINNPTELLTPVDQ